MVATFLPLLQLWPNILDSVGWVPGYRLNRLSHHYLPLVCKCQLPLKHLGSQAVNHCSESESRDFWNRSVDDSSVSPCSTAAEVFTFHRSPPVFNLSLTRETVRFSRLSDITLI